LSKFGLWKLRFVWLAVADIEWVKSMDYGTKFDMFVFFSISDVLSLHKTKGDITDLAVSSNNVLVASASNDFVIRVVSSIF